MRWPIPAATTASTTCPWPIRCSPSPPRCWSPWSCARSRRCFPGGRVDPTDASVLEAAYREAEEEIGLSARFISPLGYLDAYLSTTNYLVIPVVAQVSPSYTLSLNPHEVADTFEVPLGFLMDPAHHELHAREWKGRLRRYYAMPYEGRYIWGVTAGIIRNLYERLYGS